MSRFCLFLTLFFFSNIFTVHAQTDELMKANALAQSGKTNEAIETYETATSNGESSVELMYNLGTLYLQEKQVGKSILFLERALKHDPKNKNALANLEIANSEIKDPIFAIKPFFLMSFWTGFSQILSMELWGILALIFLAGLVFMINKILFASVAKKKKWLIMGIILSGLFLSLAAALTRYTAVKDDSFAIVMSEVDRLDGPDANSKNVDYPFISEGIKVRIRDSFEDYYKVKLPDSDESWIKKEKLEKI